MKRLLRHLEDRLYRWLVRRRAARAGTITGAHLDEFIRAGIAAQQRAGLRQAPCPETNPLADEAARRYIEWAKKRLLYGSAIEKVDWRKGQEVERLERLWNLDHDDEV